jgi:hypothetical protein
VNFNDIFTLTQAVFLLGFEAKAKKQNLRYYKRLVLFELKRRFFYRQCCTNAEQKTAAPQCLD